MNREPFIPRPSSAFTLIEIILAIAIVLAVFFLALPSITGLSAERRLLETFDRFDALVEQAQSRAISQQRTWVIVWLDGQISLQPDVPTEDERLTQGEEVRVDFSISEEESLTLERPASLLAEKETPQEWPFWRSGVCEAVIVNYSGPYGSWRARYHPLTAHGEIIEQEVR